MIRSARPEEAPSVRDLVHDAYRHYIARIGKPPGPMLDDYVRLIAEAKVWVLDDADGMAGILVLENQEDALLLDNVAIRPDSQGKGHGRTLITFAEATARDRGFSLVRLYTHVRMTENIALYTRFGFQETRRATENGFQRVYLEKAISTRQCGR